MATLSYLDLYVTHLNYSQTSIIRSDRDRQIFFELSVVRIFEIGSFREYSEVFIRYQFLTTFCP